MGSWGRQRSEGAELDAVTTWDGDSAWVTVNGELDAFTARILRTEMSAVEAAEPERVVLDLRSVRFLDSSGLAVILGARERAMDEGGWDLELVIAGSDAVEDTFAAIKAESMFSLISAAEVGQAQEDHGSDAGQ
jgi:anti-anti-sigma factor